MFADKILVVVKDSEGEPKAVSTATVLADDDGYMEVIFEPDTTLETGESVAFTTTFPLS